MAAKRSPKKAEVAPSIEEPVVTPEFDMTSTPPAPRRKWLLPAIVAVAALVAFWYKTNTWPVVAFVGMRPITRFEVNQELYKANGEEVINSLVTERLVKDEIAKKGIKVSDQEVNGKVDELRANLGESVKLEDLLAERGYTLDEVKDQLKLQLEIEKAVSDKVTLTAEEIDKFVTDNSAYLTGSSSAEKRVEAEKTLKQQKLQQAISEWIESLRSQTKVYRVGPQSPSAQ